MLMEKFNMPVLSAAIFDWDKTLVESMEGIRIATNYTLAEMQKRGYEVEIGYNEKGYAQWTSEQTQVRFSSTANEFFNNTFGSFGDDVASTAIDIWREKMFDIHLDNIEVLDGARQTLALLMQKNVPIAIVSNKDEDLLKDEVAYVMGSDAANIVVRGAQPGQKGKPYPDPIFDALSQLNASAASTVWMIGDLVSDVKAGVKSGSYPILFSYTNRGAVEDLQNDPEKSSVVSGKDVGFIKNHQKLQGLISNVRIVENLPYDPANNPHFVCKAPAPKK